MRKLLHELFYIPKYGKMKESAFLSRIAGSVTLIVLYLAAMSFAAFAYFSSSVTSGINTIKAASFTLNVNDAPVSDAAYELTGGNHTFTITWSDSTTASVGYGKILVYDAEGKEILTLYTESFASAEDACSVNFAVPDGAKFAVKVVAEWGTCAIRTDGIDGTTVDLSRFIPEVTESEDIPAENEDSGDGAGENLDNSADEITGETEDADDSTGDSFREDVDNPVTEETTEETEDPVTGEGTGEDTETQPEDSSEVNSEEDLDAGDTDIPEENTSFGETQPEEETQTDSSEVPDAPADEQTEEAVQEPAEEMDPEAFDSVPDA